MSDLSKQACVVFDHGFFFELALRLAREIGKVYYVKPWEDGMSKIDGAIVGDGFDEVERVPEIWDVVDKVNFCVFPDVHHAAMQLHLESLGMPVWGARRADELELKKIQFKKLCKSLGLEIAPYEIIQGLDRLRSFCQDHDTGERWIKMSPQYRGNQETFHHINFEQSRQTLDKMGLEFGLIGNELRFLVEQSIDADFEGGLDTYTIDGEHPMVAVQGYELKDKAYFAAVQPYSEIPSEITCVNEPLWPILKEKRCRQFLSTEVKITDNGKSFLLEPTIRMPSPAGEEQMELYNNLGDIISSGAAGQLIEPDLEAKFACEVMVEHTGEMTQWRTLEVPESARRWIKLYNTAKVGRLLGIAPGQKEIGAVVGIGNTPKECLEHVKENAEALEGQPVVVHTPDLAKILEEIEEAQESGIHFSNEPLPEPASVILDEK